MVRFAASRQPDGVYDKDNGHLMSQGDELKLQ